MPSYISSNANRFYAALEASYGQAASVTSANRFPAVRLEAQQILQRGKRVDKTGTRTFLGTSPDSRRNTAFEVRTYLTSWTAPAEPGYGPLFQAALGGTPGLSTGLVVASTQGDNAIQTTTPHGLSVGSAVSYMNEIRFVTAVQNASSISMNAPFSNALAANAALMPTLTFSLATGLPSVTLYDYWDPISAVSRIVTGAAVDTFSFSANGDFHEFVFNGPACDLLNSTSFVAGSAGLNTFPAEPALQEFDYSVVPGHLGQAWIGSAPDQFFTVTQATIELKNNIDLRNQEYGSSYPRDIAAGQRQVSSTFSLFTQDDNQTTALYDAAQQRDQISAMLQLGLRNGELMGIFLPSVTPEIPNYVDSEVRLQWDFKNNLAQGTAENELYIAFA